jgi:peptidoglycan/xylan/chitin deacetylase (PgdA/CDA1 family)
MPSEPFKTSVKSTAGAIAAGLGLYRRQFSSQMTIVAFHRVNDQLPKDGLTCGSEKFASFCRFFKQYFRVVPYSEQVRGCAAGIDMGGTLSITFDDGYLDNFEVAAPILKRYDLPATFFITTGFVNSNRVPFWDEGLPFQPGWMKWDHVRELSRQGFDIGAHTVTHLDMAAAAPEKIRDELLRSKQILQKELDKPVDLFAYPFGGREQITDASIELVKQAGFVSCASCYGGTNPPIADPFRLKRIGIAEWFSTPHQLGFEMLLGKA